MKKLSSNIRREINKLAHERAIIFEKGERERLLVMAEAGQLPDVPTMDDVFPDVPYLNDVFPDVPTMGELHALVDGPG